MSGECKSYKLNAPMTWKEFLAMPDDIKKTYIQLIRQKYNVSDTKIAKMMCAAQTSVSREFIRLGITRGKGEFPRGFDKEGWTAWCNGVPATKEEQPVEEIPVEEEAFDEFPVEEETEAVIEEQPVSEEKTVRIAIPDHGSMTYEGNIDDVVKSIAMLLSGAKVHIGITWDVLEGD